MEITEVNALEWVGLELSYFVRKREQNVVSKPPAVRGKPETYAMPPLKKHLSIPIPRH